MIVRAITPARRGFTLLELLLAMAIAIMLLGALYLAMNMTLEQTQASRDSSDIEDLHRGVINRMAIDLSATLGPLPPKATPDSASGTGGAGDTGGMTGGMTGDMTGDGSDSGMMTDPMQTGAVNYPFQGGIYGTSTDGKSTLVIFASRVPNALSTPGALVSGATGTQNSGDLRRIIYWLGSNGLCRDERPWVTADGVGNSLQPDTSNEASNTIAEEVTGFDVQFADGSGGWISEWNVSDGTSPASTGPPRAVKITLTFLFPLSKRGAEPITKTLVQVIPIRTGPGAAVVTLVDPVVPTDDSTGTKADPSGSGGSGSDGTGGGGGGGGGAGGKGGGGGGGKGGGGAGGGGKGGGGIGGGGGGKGGGGIGGGGGGKGGGGMGGGMGGGKGGGGMGGGKGGGR